MKRVALRSRGKCALRYNHPSNQTGGGINLPFSQALLLGNPSTANPIAQIPPGFEFTGITANSTLWNLEQGLTGGMIYLGLNSAGTDLSKLVGWNRGVPEKSADYVASSFSFASWRCAGRAIFLSGRMAKISMTR